MIDTIIDIFHQNSVDFDRVQAAGIVAIIHKATEGTRFKDSEYKNRRIQAKDLGFLWGCYHFSSGENVADQVDSFLSYTQPENDELVALDFEPSSSGPNMTLDQAHQFVSLVQSELRRPPVIYGGSMLREAVGTGVDPVLANCPVWYARYRSTPIGLPRQIWPSFTLWQYTDGNDGDQPHSVDGIGRCDRNRFNGTEADLSAAWPFTMATTPDDSAHPPQLTQALSRRLPRDFASKNAGLVATKVDTTLQRVMDSIKPYTNADPILPKYHIGALCPDLDYLGYDLNTEFKLRDAPQKFHSGQIKSDWTVQRLSDVVDRLLTTNHS